MADEWVVGTCGCGKTFVYNPKKVPCAQLGGRSEPICKACVDHLKPLREAKGTPPVEVKPGAYLDWEPPE